MKANATVSTTIQSWPHSSRTTGCLDDMIASGRLHDYPVVAPFKPLVFGCSICHLNESPRLSSRGPIQALMYVRSSYSSTVVSTTIQSWPHSSPFTMPSSVRRKRLHDYPVVAPFKPGLAMAGRAPLALVSTTIQSWPHSSISAALLNLSFPCVSTTIQSWPHSSITGGNAETIARVSLHDYPVVAPFKRTSRRKQHEPVCIGLHDYPVVAPFKLLNAQLGQIRRKVSTTIQSWPHSSNADAASQAAAVSSPRLSSRGPIQAHKENLSCLLRWVSTTIQSWPHSSFHRLGNKFRSRRLHDYPVVAPFKP